MLHVKLNHINNDREFINYYESFLKYFIFSIAKKHRKESGDFFNYFYNYHKIYFEKHYPEKKSAITALKKKYPNGYKDMYYNLFLDNDSFKWAKEKSKSLLQNKRKTIPDAYTAIGIVPAFNAMLWKPVIYPGINVIGIFYKMFQYLGRLNCILFDIDEKRSGNNSKNELMKLKNDFYSILDAAYLDDPFELDLGSSYLYDIALEYGKTTLKIQLLFTLLHEYGHLIFDHQNGAMRRIKDIYNNEYSIFDLLKEQELDADYFAVSCLTSEKELSILQNSGTWSGFNGNIIPSSITDFFVILRVAEIRNKIEPVTHPNAEERFDLFCRNYKSDYIENYMKRFVQFIDFFY